MSGYFHGGVRGLEVGDLLLPPSETGAPCAADFVPADLVDEVRRVYRRDRVYMASHERDALVFAGLHPGGGDLYEVAAVGDVEPDWDYIGPGREGSACAPRARVVRVLRRGVTADVSRAQIQAFIAAHEREQRAPKVGRNEPCPCGSGRKSKRCCAERQAA